MSQIKTVVFDLGKVLLDFDHMLACRQLAQYCHLTTQEVFDFLFASGLEMRYERGDLTTAELLQELETRAAKKLAADKIAHCVSHIFTIKQDVVDILNGLRQQNYRLVLLSNTSDIHWQYVQTHYRFLDIFDHYVLSFEVGLIKPEPQIYQELLKHTQCEAQACFYTDDVEENILPARALGIQAHTFINADKLKTDLRTCGIEI